MNQGWRAFGFSCCRGAAVGMIREYWNPHVHVLQGNTQKRYEVTDLELFCTVHQPLDLGGTGIKTLQVGDSKDSFADYRDNTGDNISARNGRFSELTGHYFIWKNHRADAIGFCHYRRYLIPAGLSGWIKDTAEKPYVNQGIGGVGNYASGYIIPHEALQQKLSETSYLDMLYESLQGTDVLLPLANQLPPGGFLQQYGNAHPVEPFFRMLAQLAATDNALARDAHRFFTEHPLAHWNNLFVMRWEKFSEYCEFLFELLLQLDDQLAPLDSVYQNRVCAFLSERLLNFWVWKNNLSVTELDWCMTQDIRDAAEDHQRKAAS
ncbi:hypothetical protein AB833_14795 [Chromatiales bacterium (ex Bugula neritina AB1)]|nr:hypothetical protein AB833_14795 [Chromatiales bacterium (ex Bugula neritina AB1)]